MARRPRLKSHARLLRRGPGCVQLGLAADVGVVIADLTEAEIDLVEHLDGSLDLHRLYAVASVAGVARARVTALLDTLRAHRLLLDAPTDRAFLAHLDEARRTILRPDADAVAAAYRLPGDGYAHVVARRTHHVVISGEGGLPYALGALLRAGGIGRVDIGEHTADTLDLQLRRRRPDAVVPDLVVLMATGAIRSETGEPWRRRGIPHLPLVTQGHRVVVGPLVRRGRGPCLHCLDLHRSDRDAAWPALLSQLAPRRPVGRRDPVDVESALTAITAGLASMIIQSCLDGQDVPSDLSLEVALPWPRVDHRRWEPHPRCHCADEKATMAR